MQAVKTSKSSANINKLFSKRKGELKIMACRSAYKRQTNNIERVENKTQPAPKSNPVERLLFGADSSFRADTLLQNNIDHFEWIVRNKIYPNFTGRKIVGENALTKQEINFIHSKGCKIAPIYSDNTPKNSEEAGAVLAKKINLVAFELGIPRGTAIFLEISESEELTRGFLKGFAASLLEEGYTPAFRANTDARYIFDRQFCRGMMTDRDIFEKCIIWAVSPTVREYDGMTTSHLIHPDRWKPFAPSCIKRKDIAIWQYGKNCHAIDDDNGEETTFNLDLVINAQIIVEKMF